MQITRRNALVGVGAAVATGAATAPLAIKAALAGASDARIFALVEEHGRTLAEMKKAGGRCFEAVLERMPPHLRCVDMLDHKEALQMEAFDAAVDAFDYPEVKVLKDKEDRLKHRRHELQGHLSQTEATTLQGVRAKLRISMRPGYRIDEDIVRSAAADLDRLSGRAVS